MLNLLRKLSELWKPKPAQVEPPKYEREIYVYFDGRDERRGDPIALLQAIHNDEEFRFDRHPAQTEAGDEEARQITCRMVSRVFKVEPYSYDAAEKKERGLAELEMLDLLVDFTTYMDDLQKKTDGFLISQPHTAGAQLSWQNALAMDTPQSADSISTLPDPKSGKPTESEAL